VPILARRGASIPVWLNGPAASFAVGRHALAVPEAAVASQTETARVTTTHASSRSTVPEDSSGRFA
jgi:hypothetical protein